MHRVLIASLLALAASACGRYPTQVETVRIVSSPADIRFCSYLGDVSPALSTTAGFGPSTEAMQATVVSLGGTHLYLERPSNDWSAVRGKAYDCSREAVPVRGMIRAKG